MLTQGMLAFTAYSIGKQQLFWHCQALRHVYCLVFNEVKKKYAFVSPEHSRFKQAMFKRFKIATQ